MLRGRQLLGSIGSVHISFTLLIVFLFFRSVLLQVDIRAVPCDLNLSTGLTGSANSSANCPSSSTSIKQFLGSKQETSTKTFGGHSNPSPCTLEVPYEVTTKDRMMLHAITFLKARILHLLSPHCRHQFPIFGSTHCDVFFLS